MEITLSQIAASIEKVAPLSTQESWDNCGWQVVGDKTKPVKKILVTLSVSQNTIEEAVRAGADLIISHHPYIFSPLKSVTDPIILSLIRNGISLYSAHTNWDKYKNGMNRPLADLLGLKDISVLFPETNLYKLITFIPQEHLRNLQLALYEAGGGHIGDYDHCSYYSSGIGSFRPLDGANPFIGKTGADEEVNEARLEVVFEENNLKKITAALLKSHPYETPAYDIIKIHSSNDSRGLGLIGKSELTYLQIVEKLKTINPHLRSNNIDIKPKSTYNIGILLGSGAGQISKTVSKGLDIYITGDMKYHEAELASNIGLKVFDIGHHEGESHGFMGLCDALKKEFNCEIIFSNEKGYIINE